MLKLYFFTLKHKLDLLIRTVVNAYKTATSAFYGPVHFIISTNILCTNFNVLNNPSLFYADFINGQ